MRVLYVDLEYDYGIKSRGINFIGQDGFKKSFERLGHDVKTFYYDNFLNKLPELQTELCKYADAIQPDLIFFCLFQDQISHKTLRYLKEKYQTINWFGDDQWRFESFTSVYANDFTWCITTDQFAIEKYHYIGQINVIYSQWAAIDAHPVNKANSGYVYDVSFVGGYHPYRKWFLNQLQRKGVSVDVFGHGWSNGSLSNDDMNQVFVESKINLNISNSSSLDISYVFSSFRTCLNSIRSRKSSSQIKARNFEIPFFDGFQLTDYVPTLEQYFNIGEEVSCYASPDEAFRLIQYYLTHDKERELIKMKGNQRASTEHGYTHRFKKIFGVLM